MLNKINKQTKRKHTLLGVGKVVVTKKIRFDFDSNRIQIEVETIRLRFDGHLPPIRPQFNCATAIR